MGGSAESAADGSTAGVGPLAGWDWPAERDLRALAYADTVELKVVLDGDADVWTRVVGAARPRHRRLYLLDTADAELARAGIVLRLRRRARGRDDLVVKWRHGRDELADRRRLLGTPTGRIEVDMLPGSAVWAAELRRPLGPGLAGACLAGHEPVSRLFSPEQYRLARIAARLRDFGRLDLDALRVHGPVLIEWARAPQGSSAPKAKLERCTFPDGRERLELSARCSPELTDTVAARMRDWLAARGAHAADRQRTKIETWVDVVRAARGS